MTSSNPLLHLDPLDDFLDGGDLARRAARYANRVDIAVETDGRGGMSVVTRTEPKSKDAVEAGVARLLETAPPSAAAPQPTSRRRKAVKVKMTIEIDPDIAEELRDAAVARMVDGDTLNSLIAEALQNAGLGYLRDTYFDGQPPPARRRNPRPGRRPYT